MMRFEEIFRGYDNEVDMYRESKPNWIFKKRSVDLIFTNKFNHEEIPISVEDIEAADWVVVKENIETLSDKIKDMALRAGVGYILHCRGCEVTDIQKFIDNTKKDMEESGFPDGTVEHFVSIISKHAGEGFK